MICLPAEAAFRTWSTTIARFRSSGLTCGEPVPAVSTIDLAVFHTSAAAVGAGGTAVIEAVIDLMVAETNQAFEASGADLQVALSVRSEVPYEEVDAATDLSRLGDPSDGYLDEVHVVRDLVGADLVHLVVGAEGYDGGGHPGSGSRDRTGGTGEAFVLVLHPATPDPRRYETRARRGDSRVPGGADQPAGRLLSPRVSL